MGLLAQENSWCLDENRPEYRQSTFSCCISLSHRGELHLSNRFMNQLEPFIWCGTELPTSCFPLDEVGQAGVTKLPAETWQGCLAQLSVCALGLISFRVFLFGMLGMAGRVHLWQLGCWRCLSRWGCTLCSAMAKLCALLVR